MTEIPVPVDEYTVETRYALPAHFVIKIQHFSLLKKRGIQKYESRIFEAGDCKWKLIISTEGEHISVHLSLTETSSLPADWELNAMFNVLLYNHILDNYLCFRANVRRFHVMKPTWELSKLISKKSLMEPSKGYLVDDNFVLGAEVFVINSQRVVECLSMEEYPRQHTRTLEITNFSELKSKWTSEKLSAGDCKWVIEIHPNGCGVGMGECVSIFLKCVDLPDHMKVKVDFRLCIKNQLRDDDNISKKYSHWFNHSSSGWGWQEFVPIADMKNPRKGFIVEDRLLCEMEISVQAISSDSP